MESLLASGQIIPLDGDGKALIKSKTRLAARPYWEQTAAKFLAILEEYHHKYPLRLGVPTEEVKSRHKGGSKAICRFTQAACRK